jgi:hypothetical protein
MNRYHVDLIVGGPLGIITNAITVEADGFGWGTSSGSYDFWKIINKNEDGITNREIVAMYPIARTVIRKIEKNIDNNTQ